MDWTDPDFLAEAHAWIRAHAPARVRTIEQPHVRSWATALRVETEAGVVWFKASSATGRHEAGLTRLLAGLAPDLVDAPLAVDEERGWLLTRDAGERLRELVEAERSLARWLEVLPRYAELQLAAAPHVDELLRLGVPDRRLAVLPDQFAATLDALGGGEEHAAFVPLLREAAERLAGFGIPETIQHDDLHDAQVFRRDGRMLVTDWGDAVVSHPFLTMAVTLQGVIAWGVDDVDGSEDTAPYAAAYLAPFGTGLEEALALALPLGWACRCVWSQDHYAPATAAERAEHLDGLGPRLELLARGLGR